MNEITPAQRERILERLRDGQSLRFIEAETGHRRETIGRYGRAAGLLPAQRRLPKRSAPSALVRVGSHRAVQRTARSCRRLADVGLHRHRIRFNRA